MARSRNPLLDLTLGEIEAIYFAATYAGENYPDLWESSDSAEDPERLADRCESGLAKLRRILEE